MTQILQQLPSFKTVFGQLNCGHCTFWHLSSESISRVSGATQLVWMSKITEAQIKFHIMQCSSSPAVILVLAKCGSSFYTPGMTSFNYEYSIVHYSMLQLYSLSTPSCSHTHVYICSSYCLHMPLSLSCMAVGDIWYYNALSTVNTSKADVCN